MSHAYTILDSFPIYNDDGSLNAELVMIRNPWGTETYDADYSDDSPIWTTSIKD